MHFTHDNSRSYGGGRIESGLTDEFIDDKIKKKEFLGITAEGLIEKVPQNSLKPKQNPKRKPLNLNYLNVGYYIITPLLIGVFLGYVLDLWLRTKPLFVGVGIGLGTIACFYNLSKILKNE